MLGIYLPLHAMIFFCKNKPFLLHESVLLHPDCPLICVFALLSPGKIHLCGMNSLGGFNERREKLDQGMMTPN